MPLSLPRGVLALACATAIASWAASSGGAAIFDPVPKGWKAVWIFEGATTDQLDPGKLVTAIACTNLTASDLAVRVESFLGSTRAAGTRILAPGETALWARPVALLVGESGTDVFGIVRVTAQGKRPAVACAGSVWVDPDSPTPRPASLPAWPANGRETLKLRPSGSVSDRIVSKPAAGRILYLASGVQDSASLAAAFHCTNLSGRASARLRFEFFKADGHPAGATDRTVSPGHTTVVETRPIAAVGSGGGLSGLERNMALRILGVEDAGNVVCSATGYVEPGSDTPVTYHVPLLPVQKPRPRVGK